MRPYRFSFLFAALLVFSATGFCHAQEADSVASGKKPWYLTFNFDIELKNMAGSFKQYYQGEYYDRDAQSRDDRWSWTEKRDDINKLFPKYSFNNMKLDVMLGRSPAFRFGMSYTFGLLEGKDDFGNYDVHSYLAISAIAEYQYNFMKQNETGPFVFGSFALGSYRSTKALEGPGIELFGQVKAGAGFAVPRGWMFRLWASADYLYYRETSNSLIFNKEQNIKADLNLFYLGLGFTKQIKLIPD